MFQLNTSHIRFWEKQFDILKPAKNKKGNRLFTPNDIENIKLIYHLVKERGMTLKGAMQKLKENKTDTIDNHELIERLREIRKMLVDIKKEID